MILGFGLRVGRRGTGVGSGAGEGEGEGEGRQLVFGSVPLRQFLINLVVGADVKEISNTTLNTINNPNLPGNGKCSQAYFFTF